MLKEFFRDKTPARLLMIAATLLLFVSQFFYYHNDTTRVSFRPHTSARSSDISIDVSSKGIATGWQLHPHAYVILVVLAFALLRDDIAGERWFRRFGYWGCLALIVWATNPGAPFRAPGAIMGAVACVMALAAALLNLVSKQSSAPT
jgi:hypothetical protein